MRNEFLSTARLRFRYQIDTAVNVHLSFFLDKYKNTVSERQLTFYACEESFDEARTYYIYNQMIALLPKGVNSIEISRKSALNHPHTIVSIKFYLE